MKWFNKNKDTPTVEKDEKSLQEYYSNLEVRVVKVTDSREANNPSYKVQTRHKVQGVWSNTDSIKYNDKSEQSALDAGVNLYFHIKRQASPRIVTEEVIKTFE